MDQLLTWAHQNGVYSHDSIEVKKSALGGYGIFTKEDLPEDEIVLRIPRKSTYDISTLLELAGEMKKGDDSAQVAHVIRSVLQSGAATTETAIVRSYMWALSILQSMGHSTPIDPYLEVLRTTEILDVEDSDDDSDAVIQSLIMEKRKVRGDYEKLAEWKQHMPFETAFALHQAVKLRVLEIPHADVGEDFTTNITLVPMLDFANHAAANNAVFDVDRQTEDVLLRLVNAVPKDTEVCISYSPTAEVGEFLQTYGFIPERAIYRWRIPELDKTVDTVMGTQGEKYSLIAKWLHIIPEVIISVDEKVSLQLDDSRLPLLLVPGLRYHNWRNDKDDLAELAQIYDNFEEELENQEQWSDVIYGSETAYGVTHNDVYVSIPHILEQTWEDSEEGIKLLMQSTKKVVELGAKREVDATQETDTANWGPYLGFKTRTLQKVLALSLDDYTRSSTP